MAAAQRETAAATAAAISAAIPAATPAATTSNAETTPGASIYAQRTTGPTPRRAKPTESKPPGSAAAATELGSAAPKVTAWGESRTPAKPEPALSTSTPPVFALRSATVQRRVSAGDIASVSSVE